MLNCTRCGRAIEPWEMGLYYGSFLCSYCYGERMKERERSEICTACYRHLKKSEAITRLGRTLCAPCAEKEEARRREATCKVCGRWIVDPNEKRIMPTGEAMCVDCYHKEMGAMRLAAKVCVRCGKSTVARFVTEKGEVYCPPCSRFVAEALTEERGPPIVVEEEETPLIKRLRGLIEKMLKS
ncbi:MAG: hypothetical protein QXG98_03465 [Candidatus Micrarchaeia archaeon]